MELQIYKYKNLEEYKSSQEKANIRKINSVWVKEDVIIEISSYINSHIKDVSFGICHGTRGGAEQNFFKKHIINKVKIIGTEISSTATQFPDTIEWDFHNIKNEWIDNVDFIYSNALDHSYDPQYALTQWLKCLNENGLCFLEHTKGHNSPVDEVDCFSGDEETYRTLLNKVGIVVDEFKVDLKGIQTYSIFVVRKMKWIVKLPS